MAELWFSLARAGDLPTLLKSLVVKKAQLEVAREVMKADERAYEDFVQTLIAGLSHRRPRVRFECAGALDRFGDASCREPLARLMDDPVPRVRWMAMHALSCHACGAAAGGLDAELEARIIRAANEDASLRVRRNAAVALGLAGGRGAIPALRTIIETESDAKLQRMARWALSQCEGEGQVAT